jgi:integrase
MSLLGSLENRYRDLEEATITDWNKRAIRWFVEHYKPVSAGRKDKYLRYLRQIALLVGKSFNRMQKDDVGRLVQALEKRFSEEWTFVDCKKVFKTFFRFYMDDIADRKDKMAEYTRLAPVLKAVNRIHTAYRKHKEKKLVILTKEEIEKLFRVASNTKRELATVSMLYHTAARPSEFVNMTVGDTDVRSDRIVHFTVAGKTGTRQLPLAADDSATDILLDWLNHHPWGSNRDGSLWLDAKGRPLTKSALYIKLVRLSERAGVRKVTPKLLRKAKLSHMADDGYNAYQIKKYAGHSRIETAMFYVELSQAGFEAAIRKKYGKEDKMETVLQPKRCWKCGLPNRSFHARCSECGTMLDPEEARKQLQERSDIIASIIPKEMLDQIIQLVVTELGKRQETERSAA